MNLGEGYKYVQLKLAKDQFGGYVSPSEFNTALEAFNLEFFNDYMKGYEATQEYSDDLLPFVKTLGDNSNPAIDIDSYGYAPIPTDYVRYARVNVYELDTTCEGSVKNRRMVEMLNNDKFGYRITDFYALTKRNPIGTIQNDQFYIQPTGFNKLELTYLRLPVTPVFGFTVTNGEVIYNPATSTELEWPEQTHKDFFEGIVKYMAINLHSEFNVQTIDIEKP
jgi:hypothetical protein